MDFIQPIGPIEREVDPLRRVGRLKDEREGEKQQREPGGRGAGGGEQETPPEAPPEGPVEGDDGHLHIDIRA